MKIGWNKTDSNELKYTYKSRTLLLLNSMILAFDNNQKSCLPDY
jgi:hypothetical protein